MVGFVVDAEDSIRQPVKESLDGRIGELRIGVADHRESGAGLPVQDYKPV